MAATLVYGRISRHILTLPKLVEQSLVLSATISFLISSHRSFPILLLLYSYYSFSSIIPMSYTFHSRKRLQVMGEILCIIVHPRSEA